MRRSWGCAGGGGRGGSALCGCSVTRSHRVGILPKRLASHVVKRKRQILHLNGGHEVDHRPRRVAVCGGRLRRGPSVTPSSCGACLGSKRFLLDLPTNARSLERLNSSRGVMATGALLLKAPTAAVSRGSETSKLASKNSFACEQGPRWNSCGEGAGFGGLKISRKCTALAAPRASTMTTVVAPPPAVTEDCKECTVKLRTTKGCGLGVSRYPDFVYNAEGGGGTGKAVKMEDGRWRVQFDIAEVKIPDVGFHTTTLFGIPLPPPIRIQIVPDSLEGVVDLETGKVELTFKARFYFSTGPLYRPPPLVVDTLLTTESTQGVFREGTGSRLDADGNCKLAGVARLAPINDWFMDNFLMLPSDCLANMAANITFTL